jgi:hypothetical protein
MTLETFLIVAVTDLKQKIRIVREHGHRTTRVTCVPQIWLTYDELAALMNCDPARARSAAVAMRLHRRKSRDGQTRAKLTPSLADAFLQDILRHRLEQVVAARASDLRAMRERMAGHSAALPQLPHVIAG